jgi:hypothetical protein
MGEIYEYFPSLNELLVAIGIFGFGFLLFTLMVKVTIPILHGEFRSSRAQRPMVAAPAPALETAGA